MLLLLLLLAAGKAAEEEEEVKMSMDDQAAVHEAIENHRYNPGRRLTQPSAGGDTGMRTAGRRGGWFFNGSGGGRQREGGVASGEGQAQMQCGCETSQSSAGGRAGITGVR